MTDYYWELGIDWDAAVSPQNTSHLPNAFVKPGVTSSVKRPVVEGGDTGDKITFLIFDLTPEENPVTIDIVSFTINSRPGTSNQKNYSPLMSLQPVLTKQENKNPSTFFEGNFPCWKSEPVAVTEADANTTQRKFQLTFFVQAVGSADGTPGVLRTFLDDPEMIVGPNM